ncbi:MAG: flagellar hook-length control protein FliK [Planctomycetes bacterium]|nr:flagellar hook-length control protein FliK [Planctomycetota bacterium]
MALSRPDGFEAPEHELEAAPRGEFDGLVRSLRMHLGPRSSSARLHLHPPELGRVFVDVQLSGDELRIDVRTETEAARKILLERSDQLRTALEQAGVRVDRFDVTATLGAQAASPVRSGGVEWAAPRREHGGAAEDGKADRGHDAEGDVEACGAAGSGERSRLPARRRAGVDDPLDVRV